MKKVDLKNLQPQNEKNEDKKKGDNYDDSEPEDDDHHSAELDKTVFTNGLRNQLKYSHEALVEMSMGDADSGSDIPDTIYVSSDCQGEQINIVPIMNAFAKSFVELPNRIKNTKSCVNIKNTDDKCFLYCHLLHERYRKCNNKKIEHPERLHGEKAFVYHNQIIKWIMKIFHFRYPIIIFML